MAERNEEQRIWQRWMRRWGGRAWASPAPQLRPPGFDGPMPERQGYAMGSREEAVRRGLYDRLRSQVYGEIKHQPTLLAHDWEREKLKESRWVHARIRKMSAVKRKKMEIKPDRAEPSQAETARLKAARAQDAAEFSKAVRSERDVRFFDELKAKAEYTRAAQGERGQDNERQVPGKSAGRDRDGN